MFANDVQYLESIRPLLNDKKFVEMQALVEDFKKGPGKKMQRYLYLKSWWATNYVSLCVFLLQFLFTIVNLSPLPTGDRLVGTICLSPWPFFSYDQQQLLRLCKSTYWLDNESLISIPFFLSSISGSSKGSPDLHPCSPSWLGGLLVHETEERDRE